MPSRVVAGPKLKRTDVSLWSAGTPIASKIGREAFFDEQALPVETQMPFASSARSITCPGMFLKLACITHGEKELPS